MVTTCKFSPDSKRIVSASWDNTLKLWDAESGTALATLRGHSGRVNACAYSPDGGRIVSGSGCAGFSNHLDYTVRIWDAASGAQLTTLEGHTRDVTACAYSPDGSRILSASRDKSLRLWDAKSGAELLVLNGHTDEVDTFSYSPDAKRIVSASKDKTLSIWDAEAGLQLGVLSGHEDRVLDCAYSPGGHHIISASADRTLRIWDAESGAELGRLSGHSDVVNGCAYSPDGGLIVSTSWDRTLRIWDPRGKKQILCFVASQSLSGASRLKGETIAAGDGSGRVYVLRLKQVPLGPALITSARADRKQGRKPSAFLRGFLTFARRSHSGEDRERVRHATARCEWCGKRFDVPTKLINSIQEINEGVGSYQMTCATLPKQSWNDARLLSECPECHQPVRFNPFILDCR